MPTIPHHHRRGFTLVELLAVLAIIGLMLGMLIPAVQRAREAGRVTQCSNNLKNMGLALANYQSAKRLFPPGNEQITGTSKSPSEAVFISAKLVLARI